MMAERLPPRPTVADHPVGPTSADVWVPDEREGEHPAEALKERVSTGLSTLAILAIAVGVTWGLWPHWGAWSLCCGGLALALVVSVADQARKAAPRPPARPVEPGRSTPPGPSDAGNLHTRGPGAAP